MAANEEEAAGSIVFLISDSDEESVKQVTKENAETNSRSPFDEFVAVSNSLVTKIRDEATAEKIKKHLCKVFKSAKQDYITSEEFINTVQQHLTELQKPDIKDQTIFSVVHDVIIHLKNASSKQKKKKREKVNSDLEINKDDDGSEGGVGMHDAGVIKTEAASDVCDGTEPCRSKDVNGDQSTGENKEDAATSRENTSDLPHTNGSLVKQSESSKESSKSPDRDKPSTSHDETADKADKSKRHKVRRMEKLMGKLDREIRRYSEKELSLEEMERDDSSHMIEHKLRKRFIEAWKKWCKLKGYEAKSGRNIEKKVQYEGTRYPEINLKIRKLVKHNKFPDFHDVYRVIQKTNQSKNLGIHKYDLQPLATEVFRDIGEKLSKRRINDYMYNPGYVSLLDTPDDPASESPVLKAQLDDNAARGKLMMDNVLEKYTNMARELHAPGVEPDFDRTSDPEIAPNSSDDELEGEWVEYVSDSDESQSAGPSGVECPEKESTKMEGQPSEETSHVTKKENSKKHHLELDGLPDGGSSVNKRIKLDHHSNGSEEKEKASAITEATPSSNADDISDSVSKTKEVLSSSQGINNVAESASSLQISAEADAVKVPPVEPTKCSVSIPQIKDLPSLTNSKPVPASQKIQPKISSGPSHTSTPVKSSVSRKELADVLATMKPVKLMSEGTNLKITSVVGSSSPRTLTAAAASQKFQPARPTKTSTPSINNEAPTCRIQLNSLPSKNIVSLTNGNVSSQRTPLNPGGVSVTNSTPRRVQLNSQPPVSNASSTNNIRHGPQPTAIQLIKSTNPHNNKVQTARMQANSHPSVGSTSTENNSSHRYRDQLNAMQSMKSESVKIASSTKNKTQSARMQMGTLPSTTTKAGVQCHQLVSRSVNANGNVVKITRTLVPNQRTSTGGNQMTARKVGPLGKKILTKQPPVRQSNGTKTIFHEDDDGVIVLD